MGSEVYSEVSDAHCQESFISLNILLPVLQPTQVSRRVAQVSENSR